ncbi:MAG: TIM barrel protein [Planctomycetes bacterium]|nr:TIM barrel protein [Planctomycetota bacterium]
MKISIPSYSFHGLMEEGKIDVFGYLETIRHRYGIGAADIWNKMLASTDSAYLRKVREAMDDRELVLANLCVDGPHIWEASAAARDKQHRDGLEWLKAGEILGARTIRIDVGVKEDTITDKQLDYVAKRYREFAKRAADKGYRVGPETHWGASLNVDVQKKVHDAVDHPGYGVLLHIGHWIGGKKQADRGDEMVAPWAMHTHVAANVCAAGPEDKMKMMRQAGYTGYWGVEHHSAKNEYAEVEWQLAVVRRAAKRIGDKA